MENYNISQRDNIGVFKTRSSKKKLRALSVSLRCKWNMENKIHC